MKLFIKGFERQAVEALKKRGVETFRVIRTDTRETIVEADIDHDKAMAWFVEDNDGPPYGAGSLLFYYDNNKP